MTMDEYEMLRGAQWMTEEIEALCGVPKSELASLTTISTAAGFNMLRAGAIKAMQDAVITGTGITKDGVRIDTAKIKTTQGD
jgi:hypothetical protein